MTSCIQKRPQAQISETKRNNFRNVVQKKKARVSDLDWSALFKPNNVEPDNDDAGLLGLNYVAS